MIAQKVNHLALYRPTERETAAIQMWVKSGRSVHCIRDHPQHAGSALIPNLLGGIPSGLRDKISKSMHAHMRGYTSAYQFVNNVLWPLIQGRFDEGLLII